MSRERHDLIVDIKAISFHRFRIEQTSWAGMPSSLSALIDFRFPINGEDFSRESEIDNRYWAKRYALNSFSGSITLCALFRR